MKISGNVKRKALYAELEKCLKSIDPNTVLEAPFSHFLPTKRKFRADFLCPNLKIIIEVNGGQYLNGRHNRGGRGYETDLEKLNMAQAHGYRVFQFTYEMLERGEHLKLAISGELRAESYNHSQFSTLN
jgi:very-short-patch-repair endonuclease